MKAYPKSAEILRYNKNYIAGGVVSVNRATEPEIVFVKGEGAWIWDADGNKYLDYHAAFAPHFLGHNDPYVTDAVRQALDRQWSLFGSGTTELEGRLGELICNATSFVESIQLLNTGSEATYQAIRLARAVTGRDHIIVMQGGYNGWHNDVACNLMTPLRALGPRVCPGEYPFIPISAGIPDGHSQLVHPINFNDLESVAWVCEKYRVACLITEPILQNVGVIKPAAGYLEGLRRLADRYGFVLIFDEVKTGFRHSLGGYAQICGVAPDLVVYGKAVANGYPMAVIGGRKELMDYFVHPDPSKRVLLAGTYNAHPVATAAAIATIERLQMNNGEVYRHVEALGEQIETGIREILHRLSLDGVVVRQGSVFCAYFMDHAPVDWHDLIDNNDANLDQAMRLVLTELGVYFFPIPTKQCSISAAHKREDIEMTLAALNRALRQVAEKRTASVRSPSMAI